MEEFKLWSGVNPEVMKILKPDLGLRSWTSLDGNEKQKIWQILENKKWFVPSSHIFNAIYNLNEKYKYKSFGINLLNHGGPHIRDSLTPHDCCLSITHSDFRNIFNDVSHEVWFETLSLFAQNLIKIEDPSPLELGKPSATGIIRQNLSQLNYCEFDRFSTDFNDICDHFGINIQLTRVHFIPKQDGRIIEDIYKPVINFLSDLKWDKVNDELKSAFIQYQLKNEIGYSGAITHCYIAIQAFLQLVVNEDIGKGELKELIPKAQARGLIPQDQFTTKIFKDLESYFMSERQIKGNVHPKREFANEKNARLMLNLVMVFIQHCIQY